MGGQYKEELQGGSNLCEIGFLELCIELFGEWGHVARTTHHSDALCLGVIVHTIHSLIIRTTRPAETTTSLKPWH